MAYILWGGWNSVLNFRQGFPSPVYVVIWNDLAVLKKPLKLNVNTFIMVSERSTLCGTEKKVFLRRSSWIHAMRHTVSKVDFCLMSPNLKKNKDRKFVKMFPEPVFNRDRSILYAPWITRVSLDGSIIKAKMDQSIFTRKTTLEVFLFPRKNCARQKKGTIWLIT